MILYGLILSSLVQILTTCHQWINDKELSNLNLTDDCSGQECPLVYSKEQEYKNQGINGINI